MFAVVFAEGGRAKHRAAATRAAAGRSKWAIGTEAAHAGETGPGSRVAGAATTTTGSPVGKNEN